MMHGDFPWVPDHSGDCVALLQGLADQMLSSLSRPSEHGDPHPQTLAQTAQSDTADSDPSHFNSQEVPSLFIHLSVQKWLPQCNKLALAENSRFLI